MLNLTRSLILLGLFAATVGQAHEMTECDRLVSHPLDPERITTGVSSSAVKHPEGIAACLSAVADDPENPRLNYQLARVYYYDDQADKAMPYLEMAAGAGYRQAQFVLGYILSITPTKDAKANGCRIEDLWLKSARAGRLASMVSYPHHAVRGGFSGCKLRADKAEMLGFLERSKKRKLSYYQGVLIADLIEDVNKL
jgi:hypothetical protein